MTAYGEPADGTWQAGPGFTGHQMDAASKLVYMQQRYYDPAIGRFLSVDPVASDMQSGWNFNRYNYAANSPYNFKDPDGRVACTTTYCEVDVSPGGLIFIGPQMTVVAIVYVGTLIQQSTSEGGEEAGENSSEDSGVRGPLPIPGELVGEQDGKAGPQGNRHNSGPLSPENGGSGDAEADFGNLTGGSSAPAAEGSSYPPGTQVGENGIVLRPARGGSGPRIDIPATGDKPHETLHYPESKTIDR